MLTPQKNGFTLVEVTISILILSVALLGLATTTSRMIQPVADVENEFVALQSVEDQLSLISLDPRYGVLDTLYAGTDTMVNGLPGASRVTALTRTTTPGTGGKTIDYWTVTVTVSGGRLVSPVSRELILGAS
ncbi:MAG: prepilin-type N-terminal cleavage/methylation domain-containing protein [Gemmatimonadota bacterium]